MQPIVALGASAGGLQPLEEFFDNAPTDRGWCFVVIQHLSPDYRSMMDELLARRTELDIRVVEDGAELTPDTIFLNPPNALVKLAGTQFRVTPYGDGDALPHLPINAFFDSLVSYDGGPVVTVILSGSGADGAEGVRAVHDSGGFVVVENPRAAKFPSMPQAALAGGTVDRVLDAAQMPEAIADLLRSGRLPTRPSPKPDDPWQSILQMIEQTHSIDFSVYKSPTVMRRIERRQALRGFATVADYRDYLAEDPSALEELYSDMLIGVTAFYRDPEAIASLARQAIAPMVAQASETEDLRIWVPACASGEEAYTLAIEISEAIRTSGLKRTFRVIATDVHRPSVDRAAAGIYPAEAIEAVPQTLRARYFTEHRDGWEVDRALRHSVIFSVHNALADPPFMRLNMISCRNLMIYLDDTAQKRLLSMFLFALQKDAVLFLGASETVGALPDEFGTLDSSARIFFKLSNKRLFDPNVMAGRMSQPVRNRAAEATARAARPPLVSLDRTGRSNHDREALIRGYDALLKRFAPSSILITQDAEVLTWFGAASVYVDTVSDLAERTVDGIIHPSLGYAIHLGIDFLAKNRGAPFAREVTVEGEPGMDPHRLTIRIEPLAGAGGSAKFLLVLLSRLEGGPAAIAPDAATPDLVDAVATPGDAAEGLHLATRIRELERDLRLTEESLQYVTERLETSGEELQASNEELQASNEELQASNEELQSSNEELQATNEELVSVTAEHERKIEMLHALNRDTELVVELLGYGVMVLGGDLRIRRFTELCARAFGLEPHDEGRPIQHVGAKPTGFDPEAMAQQAIKTQTAQHAEGTLNGTDLKLDAVPSNTTRADDASVVLLFSGAAMRAEDE